MLVLLLVFILLYSVFFLAMVAASLEFGEAIKEVYEPDWAGRDVTFQLLDVTVCFC